MSAAGESAATRHRPNLPRDVAAVPPDNQNNKAVVYLQSECAPAVCPQGWRGGGPQFLMRGRIHHICSPVLVKTSGADGSHKQPGRTPTTQFGGLKPACVGSSRKEQMTMEALDFQLVSSVVAGALLSPYGCQKHPHHVQVLAATHAPPSPQYSRMLQDVP